MGTSTLITETPQTDRLSTIWDTPHVDHVSTMGSEEQHAPSDIVAPETTRTRFRTFSIMVGLCAAVFLAALNQTIVATAIPSISSDLKCASGYVWISAAYLLAGAIAAPIWSKLSDIWGRKVILLTAVALFFTFSIICAVARNMEMLIIGRAFQGVAGGGLIQIVYATISDIFSMRARTFYLGTLQMMWATAGALGPLFGGMFAEYVSWRWCFWINLPIAFIVFCLLWAFLDVHNPKTGIIQGLKAVDWYGCLSLLTFMVTLLLGLNFGGTTFAWSSPLVVCLLVAGGLMAAVFALCERKARFPLLPLNVFQSVSNVCALVIGFTHDWAVFSTEFYLPLYFQSTKGASPLQSGYRIIPITLTQAVVAMAASLIVRKTGRYLELIWIGVALLTLGNGLYINLNVTTSVGAIIAFQLAAATGAGLLFQPPLIALQALVPPQQTAAATAGLGLVRNLSTSIALVVGHAIFSSGMDSRRQNLLQRGLPSDVADLFSGSTAAANAMLVGTISDDKLKNAVKGAFADSLRGVWILCTCTSACAIIASMFVSKHVLSKVHVEHRTGLHNS